MSVFEPTGLDDESWAIPAHDVLLFGERRHRHALVIPVIDEGDRIRAQLERIRAASLPVDVVVADGGSTDGSLARAFVEAAGVRAVLTKTGAGKVGAQLRIGYAWCIRQGYDGIVTIDGNGKDGVEAITDMVAALDDGCDYVQGSRYMRGGVAINTPLERALANRLIHAPLLSIAGRHLFTDTTNGFRAYSTRYLLDPRVRPFREVFQRYELLFYLTVRAGQIGMKVRQVPVRRSYPAGEAAPTKISGLKPKLALLGEALSAATGGFTPDDVMTAKDRRGLFAWILATILVAVLFAGFAATPEYSPDSWTYYELSKTVFHDFYRFACWRSYGSMAEYSSAFPPLWPTLIAVTNVAVGIGARAGFFLAFLCFGLFASLSERLGQSALAAPFVGLGVALLSLADAELLSSELVSGRSIPLQMVLVAAILLYLVKRPNLRIIDGTVVGFLAGLAILNRFDAVFLPGLLGIGLLLLTRDLRIAAACVAVSVATMSPWIVYSLTAFGRPFVSDNSAIALSVDPNAFITDWWPTPRAQFADDPTGWFAKVGWNSFGFLHAVLGLIGRRFAVPAILVAFAISLHNDLAGMSRGIRTEPSASARRSLHICLGGMVAAFFLLMPQILTGYFDIRYFSALLWLTGLIGVGLLVARGRSEAQRRTLGFLAFLVLATVSLWSIIGQVAERGSDVTNPSVWHEFDNPALVASFARCVGTGKSRTLVTGLTASAARLTAQAGFVTMFEPRNMMTGRLGAKGVRSFLGTMHVTHIFATDEAAGERADAMGLAKIPNCELRVYKVDLPAPR